ncbi:hypothetical protein [Pseudoduganella sp. OTU4001]|uniref:hypothetical protein n=1 Tax=Pseudoduganella sp. OTU4001 TaxID=3043854 RepID=UPI00313B7487
MNKYLDFIEDILDGTYDGSLKWHPVPKEKHAKQINEPWNIMRQFEAPITFEGSPAKLICVEKRMYIDDYLFPHEDRMCELMVISNDEVVKKIGPPILPWYWLSKFADKIAEAIGTPAVHRLA